MPKFIEVHCDCIKKLINLDHVYEIEPTLSGPNDGAWIYFAFESKDAIEPEYIKTDESYYEIKRMVMEATNG